MDGYRPRLSGWRRKEPQRWRTHRMVDDLVNLCGNSMYPQVSMGPYGYRPEAGSYALERAAMLSMIQHPLRRPSAVEQWSPLEVAKFEGAMCIYGKQFHKIAAEVGTKTCQQAIEFYYVWKLTGHYKQWKKVFYGTAWVQRAEAEKREHAIAAVAADARGHAVATAAAADAAAAVVAAAQDDSGDYSGSGSA
ncbi:hypothetical protein JKP88DRAFT_316246 [Tribonema minus]|uniref:SANT domain-containing protein n=1 Tax=Tribonema minus TaxID=303371 RepID=A0A835Z5U6_9STRA|nr:hypothetical protein JKP88DRAFT_316246 [Tribonema minus]